MQVFKYFLFGFPPNWETYAANCFRGEAFDSVAAAENAAENTSVTDNLLCKSESKCIWMKFQNDTLLLVGFV